MIALSRLNGQTVAINPDLITWIEITPDTTVSLLGGDRIIVRESLDEVIEKVIEFRRAVGGSAVRYEAALERVPKRSAYPSRPPSLYPPKNPSERPPGRNSLYPQDIRDLNRK